MNFETRIEYRKKSMWKDIIIPILILTVLLLGVAVAFDRSAPAFAVAFLVAFLVAIWRIYVFDSNPIEHKRLYPLPEKPQVKQRPVMVYKNGGGFRMVYGQLHTTADMYQAFKDNVLKNGRKVTMDTIPSKDGKPMISNHRQAQPWRDFIKRLFDLGWIDGRESRNLTAVGEMALIDLINQGSPPPHNDPLVLSGVIS